MSPLLGEARLISAMIAGRRARSAVRKSRGAGACPGGFAHRLERHGGAFRFELGALGGKNSLQN